MKKVLKVVTLFAALALTACNGGNAAQSTSGAGSKSGAPASTTSVHSHKWVEDTAAGKPATCESAGTKVEKCECGETKSTPIPALEHEWEKVKDYAEEAGYSKTAQYKCKHGDHYAIRWTALDYTASVNIEENGATADNPNSVRLKTAQYDNGGSSEAPGETVGSSLTYKFKSGAAVQKAGFAFNAVLKYGNGAPAPLFDAMSGDQQKGWIEKPDGTKELATKRYQLKVNGQVVEIGEDKKYGNDITGEAGKPQWYDWPVEFPVVAGENTVEILCLGGYRAYLYDFQVTGLPQNA